LSIVKGSTRDAAEGFFRSSGARFERSGPVAPVAGNSGLAVA